MSIGYVEVNGIIKRIEDLTPEDEQWLRRDAAIKAAKRAREMKKPLKEFYIYRQEFKYKVSYMVPGPKDYVPSGAKRIAVCHAISRAAAMLWMKERLAATIGPHGQEAYWINTYWINK